MSNLDPAVCPYCNSDEETETYDEYLGRTVHRCSPCNKFYTIEYATKPIKVITN
jgi:transposase-like protein